MNRILIISKGYPFYGGQSTTAYNLHLFLNSKNIDSKLLMLNDFYGFRDINHKKNEDRIKSSSLGKLKYRLLKMLTLITGNHYFRLLLKVIPAVKVIRRLLIVTHVKIYLKKTKFSPDLVICNTSALYEDIHKWFNKSIIIVGTNLLFYRELENKNGSLPKSLIRNLNKSVLIFNSELTRRIYVDAGVNMFNSSVCYFNFTPYAYGYSKGFETRKYDIAFVSSIFNRKIKNAKLSYSLFNNFSDSNKIAIGSGSESFRDIKNTAIMRLVSQKEIAEVLSETKLLIITSYFDSSPSILSEAVLNGCNVLASKNVGWHEVLNTKCVIEDYENKDEWVSKMKYLIDNKVENNIETQYKDIFLAKLINLSNDQI